MQTHKTEGFTKRNLKRFQGCSRAFWGIFSLFSFCFLYLTLKRQGKIIADYEDFRYIYYTAIIFRNAAGRTLVRSITYG
jgi:hypothetical protein